jgi:hypothetical protein
VGASCTVRLRFYPQIGVTPALPVVQASLAIFDNAPNSPQNVTLTGTPQADALLDSLSPSIATAGGAAFKLTVNGSGFTSNSTVYWGSNALATQFVNGTQVAAQVPASDIARAGIDAVTVQNPSPGGSTSNALQFEVDSPGTTTPPTFTPTTATIAPGATATFSVTLPASATDVSATCLNLPTGATCGYSATAGTVAIATTTSVPVGTYQITVVFAETLPDAATAAFVALPILLLPLFFIRKKLLVRRLWFVATLAAALSIATVGCGGSSGTIVTNPQTYQVTSSGTVQLTVQ